MTKILFFILLIVPNVAMSYETARYEVIKNISDKIEIREYKDLVLATISTKEGSQNNNFRTLFKFISGENAQNQEIKMTTPVFQEYIQNEESMSFVMPDRFNKNNLPKPQNSNVKIEYIKNTQFIAIRFTGRATDKNFSKYQDILKNAIKANDLKADLSNPINAYYNPPWTIPFFKRNEVLFRLN